MDQLEELKGKHAAEIERARQNVRDLHAVEKRVRTELGKAKSLSRDCRLISQANCRSPKRFRAKDGERVRRNAATEAEGRRLAFKRSGRFFPSVSGDAGDGESSPACAVVHPRAGRLTI
jgi:hypothetical protein